MRNHLAEMEKARKLKIEKLNIELSKKKREINRFKPKHFGATSQSAIDRLSTPTIGQLRSTSHRYGLFKWFARIFINEILHPSIGNILQKEEPEMLKKFQKNLHKMESDVETVRKFRVLKIQEFKPEVEVRAQNPRPGKLKKTKDPKIPEPVWRHKSGTPDPDRLAFLSQPRIGLLVTTLEEHGKLIEKINPNIKENLAVRIQNSSIEKHKLRHKEDVKEVKPIKHFSAKEWKERCFLQSQPKTNYLFQVFEDHQHLFSEEKKDKLYQFIHELDKRDLEKKSVQRALKFCQPKAIKKVKEARHPDRAEILSIPKKLAKLEDPRKLLKPE